MRDQLATPGIGSWGQLLEWLTERKGPRADPGSPDELASSIRRIAADPAALAAVMLRYGLTPAT